MKKIILVIAAILVVFLYLTACKDSFEIITKRDFALDTLCEINLYNDGNDDVTEEILDESIVLIKELESTLSAYEESSDIYNLNQNAGENEILVSQDTYEVLQYSIMFSNLTDGLFDVTSGPLIELWDIDPPNGYVPTDEEKKLAISKIGYENLELLEDSKAYLSEKDMQVNLGAIAKGFIADKVKDQLVSNGVDSCVINLGGNVLLIGNKPDGSDFSIGIQDPNDDRNEYLLTVSISDEALVTSGDYERYFEQDGVIYHHILNPKTGMPADTNIKQVTIIAENSVLADSLSTCVLLLGIEKGLELVEKEGVECIIISKDKNIYITQGIYESCSIDQEYLTEKGYNLTSDVQDLY